MTPFRELVNRWIDAAGQLQTYGAIPQAAVLEQCAEELADVLQTFQDQPLTYVQAASESGYSVAHLRRLVSQGTLRDIGQDRPRLRRGDLPRKPGHLSPTCRQKGESPTWIQLQKGGAA